MRDLPLAREMYRKCVEEDPHYAPAWAGLARCHRILAKFRAGSDDHAALAEEAFQRAFALNPRCPGIHSQHAYHEAEQGRARDAITRLLQELDGNPHNPEHHAAMVHVCRYAGLLETSLAAHHAAVRLDRGIRTSVMNTYFVMGQYAAALECSTDNVGFMEAMILEALGRREEALERVRRREGLPPLMGEWMTMLELFVENRREEAAQRLLEIDRQGVDPEGFYYRARLLSRMGAKADALATLERALQRGYYCAPAFLTEPYLDGLRGTERFQELAAEAVRLSGLARAAFVEGGGDGVYCKGAKSRPNWS
jgi:tetratricopeptide (TPR) repeat protein